MGRKQARQLSLCGLLIGVVLGGLPAQAQISTVQVGALVEALRQAAPQTGIKNDGLYSDWQVLAGNIPRWSKACTGQELSATQFEASPATARSIVTCVITDVLKDEYKASGNDQSVAVRRTAAWWMTGDPNRYGNAQTAPYTEKVLSFYQRQLSSKQSPPAQPQESAYDRYMRVGYAAVNQKDDQTALINFRRALSERPSNPYATAAIRSVEGYIARARPTSSSTQPPALAQSPSQAVPITQDQAVNIINQWLQAKQQVFAPPFNTQSVAALTAGELATELVKPDGTVAWLKKNNAYYRFGVQKIESVERFLTNRDKATIEVRVTEDRTLYRNGKVDPSRTDFQTRLVRYSLQSNDGKWKIADYKTADGSTPERTNQ